MIMENKSDVKIMKEAKDILKYIGVKTENDSDATERHTKTLNE